MTITTNLITGAMQTTSKLGRRLATNASYAVGALKKTPVTVVPPKYQPRSAALMLRHISDHLKFAFFSRLYDLTNLRFNLMAASSLILVTCRSVVANSTARKAKGTPQEVYRYQEAVKTTFREFLAFTMSYILLMYAQRFVVDGLRSVLWVRKGVTRMPTIFNPLLQSMFGVPNEIRKSVKGDIGPTLSSTLKLIGKDIQDYRKGRQILPLGKMELKQKWIQAEVLLNAVEMDSANRKQQYEMVYKYLMKPIAWIANKDLKKMTQEETLRLLFEWAPPLLGAIPAIIMSGFYSEMATQKYAEPFARFVANLRTKKNNPVVKPSFAAASTTPLTMPQPLPPTVVWKP